MGLANKGFELPGVGPGVALNWTVSALGHGAVLPNFGGAGLPTPVEKFETGWGNDTFLSAFGPSDVTVANFNTGLQTSPFESFEAQWGNNGYLFFLSAAFSPNFGGGLSIEGFEVGWGNDTFLFAFTGSDITAALFGNGTGIESFETGWANNSYQTTLSSVTYASFDGANAQAFEDFNQVSPPKAFATDMTGGGTGLFISPAHGYAVGDQVSLKGPGLPLGFLENVVYYVYYPPGEVDVFQLSLAPNPLGTISITLGSNGKGTVFGNPALYWNTVV